MAAKTFLRLVSGRVQEIFGVVTSGGAANDGDIAVLDSTGRFDSSVMPLSVGGADTQSVVASEALAAGALVNLYNNGGTINARNADATAEGKEANGFVLAAVSSGGTATVYFSRLNNQRSGLTIGSRYYLATTAGTITATPPSTSGNVNQYVGKALSATVLAFEPDDYIVRA